MVKKKTWSCVHAITSRCITNKRIGKRDRSESITIIMESNEVVGEGNLSRKLGKKIFSENRYGERTRTEWNKKQ